MKKIFLTLVLALSFSFSALADDGHTPIVGFADGHTPIVGLTDGHTPIVGNTECKPDEQCVVESDGLFANAGQAIIDIILGLG